MYNSMKASVLLPSPTYCGVGYLGNILLNLDIMVTFTPIVGQVAAGAPSFWSKEGEHYTIKGRALEHFQNHFHVLFEKQKFTFADGIQFFVGHCEEMYSQPHEHVVLLVRDPIDAIYSSYQKNFTDHLSFIDYLDSIVVNGDIRSSRTHFYAHPIEQYALFVMFWLTINEKKPLIVRFEDLKSSNATNEIQRILSTIGANRSQEAINQAIEKSALKHGKPLSTNFSQINRRGAIFEWKERMDTETWLNLIGGYPSLAVCQELGYVDAEMAPKLDNDPLVNQVLDVVFKETHALVKQGEFTYLAALTKNISYLLFSPLFNSYHTDYRTLQGSIVPEYAVAIQHVLMASLSMIIKTFYTTLLIQDLERRMRYFANQFYLSRNNPKFKLTLAKLQDFYANIPGCVLLPDSARRK